MGIEWFKSEKDEITHHYGDIESITTIFLTNLAGEYDIIWDRIVTTVRESVKAIKSYIASVDSSVSSVSGSGVSGSSPLRVKVNPDGNAPKGLSPGTIVETAGGDYRVIGVRPDGSYESEKIKKRATGGIIEKRQDVLVGEEGFEIGILPSGKTILFGKHGSELVNIPEGTTIIPHEESKDIVEFTGNIDGKKIPKYKDGAEGAIPKYALGLIGAVVGAGLASGILKNIVGSSKKEEPVDVKVVEIKDDNRYYAPITPTREPKDDNRYYAPITPTREPSLHDLIGIETPDFFTEMSREFKRGSGKYSESIYKLLEFEGYDRYLENRKKIIEEIKSGQEDLLNAIDADAINKRKEDLVQALMLDKDLSEVNKKAIKNRQNLIDKLKELEAEMQELNLQALDNDWYYNAAEAIFDDLKVSAPSGSNMSTEEYRNYILEAFRSGEKIDEWIFDVVQTQRDIVAKTIATGGTIEDANNQIKELYGGHLLLQEDVFNTLNDSFIEAPEISELIKTKQDEIKKVQQELFRQIDIRDIIPTEQEVLDMIDQQLLEDARTQSWLKVDLLEQMKANVEKYTTQLKEKYDEALASSDTELARQIFEEYNASLTQQLQIEQQIQQAIKQRYEMEFALIDKKINKEKQIQSFLQKELQYAQKEFPENYERQQLIQEEILNSETRQGKILKSTLADLIKQRDLLKVGSSEWNILNDRAADLESKIQGSNQAILDMEHSILELNFNNLLKDLDKFEEKMNDLEYELQLKQILNPDDIDGISAIYDKMASVSNSQIDSLYTIVNQLRDQQGLLDSTSSQWGVIGSQIDDVVAKIKAANLALAHKLKIALGNILVI